MIPRFDSVIIVSKRFILWETEQELVEQSALGRCVAILNLSPDHPAYTAEGLLGDVQVDSSASNDRGKEDNNAA
jgi:hypothetical protein